MLVVARADLGFRGQRNLAMQAVCISCIEGKFALLQGVEGSDPLGRGHWITSGQLPFLAVLRVCLTGQGQHNGKGCDKRSVSVHK